MLIFGLCEGVSLLRKITITVDDVTLDCLRAMHEVNGIPYSAAIRRAVLSYYQDKFATPPAQKKQAVCWWQCGEGGYYVIRFQRAYEMSSKEIFRP